MSKQTLIYTFTHERWRLRSLARHFLGNDSDADDALQDAFIKLWPKAEHIDNEQHSNALAMTTVRNLAIDKQRRRHVTTTSVDESISIAEPPPDNSKEETLQDVEAIIEQELTDVQRQIIRMRDYEGREYDEIAALLQLQPTAVRMQLSRARKRIREIYNERKDER